MLKVCIETETRHMWKKEGQFRITGSRCYKLYTYSKDDWPKIANDYFWPKPFSNKYIEHGIYFEKAARDCYSKKIGESVVLQTGLIVDPKNVWLGYSPDGVVFQGDIPTKLLEIKCPFKGKNYPFIVFFCTTRNIINSPFFSRKTVAN